jgi:hypothetical protein
MRGVSASVPGVIGQAKTCCDILRAGVYTDNAVGLEGHGRRIFLSSICKQWPNIAFVVDLYSLLCRWRMVSRRGRLENEPVDGREYENFSNQAGHADRVRSSDSSGVWYEAPECRGCTVVPVGCRMCLLSVAGSLGAGL